MQGSQRAGYPSQIFGEPCAPPEVPGFGADCLATCEVESIAKFLGESVSFVLSNEHWVCRGLASGVLPSNPDRYASVYVYLVKNFGFISPSGTLENVLYFMTFFVSYVINCMFIAAM